MQRYLLIPALFLLMACATPREHRTVDASALQGAPANLFSSYQPRGRVVGQVRDGERVSLIRRDGDGCEVETAQHVRGWLNCALLH